MRIYTRGGDTGETGLFGGGRVSKDHPRVEAYGAVDELNAVLGTARASGLIDDLDETAARVQGELFVLGADLATPGETSARNDRVVRLGQAHVDSLERNIDNFETELVPLKTFILPGGQRAGAALHLARTICRRAERRAITLQATTRISPFVVPYLNRLGDLLFVMARLTNARHGRPEQPWKPKP